MIDTLNTTAGNFSNLKSVAKDIIKQSKEAIVQIKGVKILKENETWLTFTYCGREFLIKCLWKRNDFEGKLEWAEIRREYDGSVKLDKIDIKEFDIETSDRRKIDTIVFNQFGQVSSKFKSTICKTITPNILEGRIESTKDILYPFETIDSLDWLNSQTGKKS